MNERVLDLLKSGFVKKKDLEHTEEKRGVTYTKKVDIEDIMNKELDPELVKMTKEDKLELKRNNKATVLKKWKNWEKNYRKLRK